MQSYVEMTNAIQKDPHSLVTEDGEFTYVLELKIADGYPKTTAAMGEVAAAELKDDRRRKKENISDYTSSFEKLMTGFDCFVHEFHGKQMKDSGTKKARTSPGYDSVISPEAGDIELTLRLLWLLRNICFHEAKWVSKEYSDGYSELMERGRKAGRHSLVNLPDRLEDGKSIVLDYDRYKEAKECLFKFIRKKGLPEKDILILRTRSSITNIKFSSDIRIGVYSRGCYYMMRYIDLKAAGIDVDLESDRLTLPENIVLPNQKVVVFVKSGISIPIFIERSSQFKRNRMGVKLEVTKE